MGSFKKTNSATDGNRLPTAHSPLPTNNQQPTAHCAQSTSYIELHARSAFSFLEGAAVPEELIAAALALEMPAMALLDRDGVYGSPRFHLAAKKNRIKAHIGAEITVQKRARAQQSVVTIPVLVRNRTGYQNLCRLITLMKLRVPKHAKPGECAITPDELAEYAEGLVCLTGANDGPLAKTLNGDLSLNNNLAAFENAQRRAEWLVDVFGKENVYAELQRHFNREEEARNQTVIQIARRLGLPLLATNGVNQATAAQREVADVFTCIRNHVRLETAGRLLAKNSEAYLKPAKIMQQLFADLPEAIYNTVELSSRLEFTLEDLGYEFPKYPVPEGETMTSFLRRRTEEGARLRYTGTNGKPAYKRARQQLEHELTLIEKLKLEGYFLIVWDIVQFCRQQGILIQGRGSAANSAVCYSLGITAVDPIGMELLFERFLSEERGEWPDIDLDLPSGDQRERAIQYVYQRYGKLGAAMTANVITYRGRSAAREVGKALDFDDETLARLAGLVHTWEWKDPKDSTERQFRDAGLDLRNPRIKKFFQLYGMVQDLPRHLGQHSGGMVICQGQLDSVVPLEPASMPGRVVVQWDKEDCADLGLIKVDLLGLGMMAVLEESIQLIRDSYKEEVDLAHLPQDDAAVYRALQKADTIGMFQVESRAQMSCLPRLRPQKFYDIVVQVAIIRPGPIVGNMVHPYLKRRQGREEVVYAHPSLEPVLKRTLGVPLFQEQLLKMAMICANFSGGEAEELRRAFGFKRSEARMKEVEIKLRRGMARNGLSRKAQDEIVQAITSFALYGFPESHAASFALIAYASAYLKCHYLVAFTAAILNNQPMGFYQPFTLVKDAQRHGLQVRPVDVTRSDWLCTIEDEGADGETQRYGDAGTRGRQEQFNTKQSQRDEMFIDKSICDSFGAHLWAKELSRSYGASSSFISSHSINISPPRGFSQKDFKDERGFTLRLGLRYVKGLKEESGRAIVRARAQGPFLSIDDLHHRVPELRKDELRKLAAVGALNFIQSRTGIPACPTLKRKLDIHDWKRPQLPKEDRQECLSYTNRRDALWQVERVARPAGELYEELYEPDGNSPLTPMTRPERMDADFRGTGLTIGRHPVAYHRSELNKLGACRAIDMQQLRNGSAIKVGGWVIVRQRPGTAKGFVFLTLEDETGVANVIITPQLFDKYRLVLVDHPFLLISGTLQNQDNVISVKAKSVRPLSFKVAAAPSHDFH
ncbi:MAG TPA: error-prone DNA polymerase [Blastocatellia bacterium]|jgi:error-prone DNA polymerase|nr:error-prone DNA polymerase [Blastocatellia bacterium]HCX32006.1 error-prone DNA polymerase [Blastocatellia bacterium]